MPRVPATGPTITASFVGADQLDRAISKMAQPRGTRPMIAVELPAVNGLIAARKRAANDAGEPPSATHDARS